MSIKTSYFQAPLHHSDRYLIKNLHIKQFLYNKDTLYPLYDILMFLDS